MKKSIIFALALICFVACGHKGDTGKVFARFVPERFDDFIFENNLIAGRIYGEALENCGKGQLTSPGIDVWVKIPGKLVCDQRYKDELENGKTYHKDWGNGKDCYKVGRTLGAGASAPIVGGEPAFPASNFRSHEILENKPDKVVFVLHYPEWTVDTLKISLSKKISIVPDTYFCKVEDIYTFNADSITVAAGVFRHPSQRTIVDEVLEKGLYSIWEHASDTSVEPEDGLLGIAVRVPDAEFAMISPDASHGLVGRSVKSGEVFSYSFGSCWSKGNIKTSEEWFRICKEQ